MGRVFILRSVALVSAVALAIAAVVWNASIAQIQLIPPFLGKHALDADGVPITGPVNVGDIIQYVIEYDRGALLPGNPIEIVDRLSANQSYIDESLMYPPGWTHTPAQPYSGQRHSTMYSHDGRGSLTSFVIDVPVNELGQSGTAQGDGTFPITIGNKVYGIFHHKQFLGSPQDHSVDPPGGQIMCWDLFSLQPCDATWPKSLDSGLSLSDRRTTPGIVHHHVYDRKIYYPSARWDGTNTMPGIGCWDTVGEAPCAFIQLPPSWLGKHEGSCCSTSATNLNRHIAGVVGVADRVFMQAGDTVYCRNVSTGSACAGWTDPTGVSGTPTVSHIRDIILDEGATPQRLFVHAGGNPAKVTCLELATGNLCNGWPVVGPNNTPGYTLSPMRDSGGAMVGVCLHPLSTGSVKCWAFAGSTLPETGIPTVNTFAPFRIPGTARVLYPQYMAKTECREFASGSPMACTTAPAFTAEWYVAPSNDLTQDYGYAVDPAAPDRCLLGLGNKGVPWRFTRTGGYGANGCVQEFRTVVRISDFFCGNLPTSWRWTTLTIHNRPLELTGGSIRLSDKFGNLMQVLPITSANTYALSVPSTGPNAVPLLQVKVLPDYSTTPVPHGYQIELAFQSDMRPRICYSAKVDSCGPVSNSALLTSGKLENRATVNLGAAVGESCVALPPCCPPWNKTKLEEMLFYQGTGGFSAPYRLLFTPTPALNTQMNAYINYLSSIGCATSITMKFDLYDGEFNASLNNPPPPPSSMGTGSVTWTGGGSPTGSFTSALMNINQWYRVETVISLSGGTSNCIPEACAEIWKDWRIQMRGKRGLVIQTRLPNGRMIEKPVQQAQPLPKPRS